MEDPAQMAGRWEAYLKQLEQDDPEEYRLLLEEMKEMVPEKQDIAFSKDGTSAADESQNEAFTPVLPGGKTKMGKDGVQQQHESQVVRPEPGFVLKTRQEDGVKVFVNICQSPLLQPMGMKKTLMDDGTEQEGMNIPLSLGPPREDKDKSGKRAIVYDIIVHPDVVKNTHEDNTGSSRNFLCELAIQYVENKYKAKLDYRFKLPKMKYKGDTANVPVQHIRKQAGPRIEEVSENVPKNNATLAQARVATPPKAKQPAKEHVKYSFHQRTRDNGEVECQAVLCDPIRNEDPALVPEAFVLRLQVPRLSSFGSEAVTRIKLEVAPEFVSFHVPSVYHNLELYLPRPIIPDSATAEYDSEEQLLILTMPIDGNYDFEDRLGPDPGSRPWLLANALRLEEQGVESKSPEVAAIETTQDREDDVLPEDKFHRSDMISQHIKDERERQRLEKVRDAENKRKEQEQKDKRAAQQAAEEEKKKMMDEVRQELVAEKHKGDEQTLGLETASLDLF